MVKKPMVKFWPSFFSQTSREEKASRFSTLLSYQRVGTPLWTADDFENQVAAGYQKNAIVYRCVTLIMHSLSTVPLTLYHKGTTTQDHPLLDVLAHPNPLQNYVSFFESMVAYLLLAGNCFVEAVAVPERPYVPAELYILRPDRMRIIPGPNGFPCGYEYSLGSQKKRVSIHEGKSPILHIKLFHPLEDHRGMSPLLAAQSMIDLQNIIASHNLALLQNAGCPSGALMVKGARLTPTQHQELREELSKIKGKGAGNMLLLDGEFDWKEMGLSPKDMDFGQGRTMAARDIAQVFGVPPMCVGILGDSTYANYQEARLHLWEDTLIPMLDFLLSHLNQWFTPLFGSDLRLSYCKDDIHALIPRREKVWEKVERMHCLTINEKRKILGYDPMEGGDILAVPLSSSSLSKEIQP